MQHQLETNSGAELERRTDDNGNPLPKEGERPAWLPENFKTPEDLAKSYSEAQAELTRLKQETAKGGEEKPEEKQGEAKPEVDKVQKELEAQGVDVNEMSNRFWQTGEVSTEDRAAIKKASPWVTDEMITSFAEGQKALSAARTSEVLSDVGGMDGFNELASWAKENWSAEQIKSLNTILAGDDLGAAKMALGGLKSAKEAAVGSDPQRSLNGGKPGAASGDVYASNAQLQADMRDPRYKVDPSYRQSVQDKLMRSSI